MSAGNGMQEKSAPPRPSDSIDQLAAVIADRARLHLVEATKKCRLLTFGDRAIALHFDNEFDDAECQQGHAAALSEALAALLPMAKADMLDPNHTLHTTAAAMNGLELLASLTHQLQRNLCERGAS